MEGKLVWKGRMLFEGETDVTGKTVLIDAHPHHGGQGVAATPMEHLLLAVAGCTALDVVAILRKMKQELREYWVEIHAERHPEHPRRFTKVVLIHHFKGENLDPQALEKAVKLSDEKYCSASATLRMPTEVESRFVIDEA
ncbi:MAG: OsmC family protein [Fimbriimonadales bacterium]|jgi:putative redox protein|nr:OsmC family protein [Fimbriimonadales bacterium]CUU11239.1 putative redox protein [Armatimonadetes bacterium GBS]CUU34478.1 putative redox protein [Armatimonadetes bacterium GXS]